MNEEKSLKIEINGVLFAVIIGGLSLGGWYLYDKADTKIDDLNTRVAKIEGSYPTVLHKLDLVVEKDITIAPNGDVLVNPPIPK